MTTKPISRTQDQLNQMTPEDCEQLRQAYYKAAEGLQALKSALRVTTLAYQHMQTTTALKDFNKIDLGQYL